MVNNFSKDLLTASSHPALRLWNRLAGQGGLSRLESLDGLVSKKIQENTMVPIPNDLEFSVRIFNSNGWIVIGGQSAKLRKKWDLALKPPWSFSASFMWTKHRASRP